MVSLLSVLHPSNSFFELQLKDFSKISPQISQIHKIKEILIKI